MEALVHGENLVKLGDVEIQNLAPSIAHGEITEVDKLNIVEYLSIDPFIATIKPRVQPERVIQGSMRE